MNVEIEINTQLDFDKDVLKSSLEKLPKKTLGTIRNKLQMALEVTQEVIDTPVFKKGDYVKSKSDPSIYGRFEKIGASNSNYIIFTKKDGGRDGAFTSDLELWTPQKGDLCIFWDTHFNSGAIIRIFKQNLDGTYVDFRDTTWDNCVPYINEEQFKEVIGYDSQS